MRSEHIIQEKTCFIYKSDDAEAILLQAVGEHELKMLDREVEMIKEQTDISFTMAAFLIEDWNRELSPWEAPAVFGNEKFGSGASETLSFITDALLPEICGICGVDGKNRYYLGGYSLSGLFSLWAAYQTDLFCGIAAVSPSVWFPGWIKYAESNVIQSPEVYLSLGEKEEKARNRLLSTVGDNIRRQYELLSGTDAVKKCELEWNPGNHFMEPEQRTAKGFAWLLNNTEY